ncbi:Olfactory receptor 7G1 [Sciurus carolinensis]|uniref:Olfactory receptor 7G1 n=1 Tax=Sciurus carolinensis TaxID=30640 RepID=A0AA41MHU8_SCICA|nr:Olfactory receptor 7G1 [Sciurus carolinensis]
MLVKLQTQDQSLTYTGCLSHVAFVIVFAFVENLLLEVVKYDLYVAICQPLMYTFIMNRSLCVLLFLSCLLISITVALFHTLMVLRLSFCTNLEIPNSFCELAQVIKFFCSDTIIDNTMVYVSTSIFGGVPFSGITFSYIHIVSSVLRMSSSEGKHKPFSTCGSHLSVVSLFYRTGCVVYISSAMSYSLGKTAVTSVMYSVVPQMLNPFIYSLRNRDMKESLNNLISRTASIVCFNYSELGFLEKVKVTGSLMNQRGWTLSIHSPK